MKFQAILLLLLVLLVFSSCSDDSGPKGNTYIPDKTVDDIVQDVMDAQESDGWVYLYDVDLHRRIEGDWEYAGRYSVYMGLSDDDDCNLWVDFDNGGYKMPVYSNDRYGYNFKVQWRGEWYYF